MTADPFPSFDRLFPALSPGDPWRPTVRTAAVLYTSLGLLADDIEDDILTHGDRPVEPGTGGLWSALDRLPTETWDAEIAWRRGMAGAVDALAADLEHGRLPFPRCRAEHEGLALAMTDAAVTLVEDPDLVADEVADLPADPMDYDWTGCRRHLLTTRGTRSEALHLWFVPFPDVEPR